MYEISFVVDPSAGSLALRDEKTQTWRKGAGLLNNRRKSGNETSGGGSDSHLGSYIKAGTCLLL